MLISLLRSLLLFRKVLLFHINGSNKCSKQTPTLTLMRNGSVYWHIPSLLPPNAPPKGAKHLRFVAPLHITHLFCELTDG